MSPNHPICTLKPVNLHVEGEFEELRQQRVVCGWNYETSIIKQWREMMDQRQKSLFWIQPLDSMERAGHISLDCSSNPQDLELANPDKSVLTIATFFVKPASRSLGLGRAAMDILESWASQAPYGSPNCQYIAINTLSKKYVEDDGEEWRGMWAQIGMPTPPKGRSIQGWYERRGYVMWKEQPQYSNRKVDGREIRLVAVYLRKPVQLDGGLAG